MTALLLFLGFLVVVGCVLLAVDDQRRRGRARNKTLRDENTALRAFIDTLAAETQAQLTAGVPEFDYIARLITESGFTSTHKELPR